MQKQKKKLRVFIGRFNPLHNGHVTTLNSIKDSDEILILIGSSNRSRSLKNPFTFAERHKMVFDQTFHFSIPVGIIPLEDNPYNDNEWISNVQDIVARHKFNRGIEDYSVEIVCSDKEDSSSYPHWFPGFDKKIVPALTFDGKPDIISATEVRDFYFSESWEFFKNRFMYTIPTSTMNFMKIFRETRDYSSLKEEYDFVKAYKKSWEVAPYPPIFVTTDAIVVQSGHVLLIQRKDNPGKGYWAIPGGFLNPGETLKDGVIRELVEETQIKVPELVLNGSIIDYCVFDKPDRSSRGRTITHAFYFRLRDELSLPHIKGSDDALKAKWVPLSELHGMRDQFFEDHYFILKKFL